MSKPNAVRRYELLDTASKLTTIEMLYNASLTKDTPQIYYCHQKSRRDSFYILAIWIKIPRGCLYTMHIAMAFMICWSY